MSDWSSDVCSSDLERRGSPVNPTRWHEGHRVELLENGEEFYPRVLAAIDAAKREVLLETFILFDDPAGQPLQKAVIAAAQRGVNVQQSEERLDGKEGVSNWSSW